MSALRRLGPIFLTLLVLVGCGTVSYDEQADQQLTKLSQQINLQLLTWANQAEAQKPVPYDPKFYDQVQADITTLEIRMEASQDPATANLIPVFRSIFDQVQQLRNLHMKQKTFASGPFLRAELDLLNVQIAALMTFELSLKPGQSGGSAGAKTQSTSTKETKAKADNSASARQTTAGR